MNKKVSNSQKSEMLDLYLNKKTIKEIAEIYSFSLQTITRQIKLILGPEKFQEIKKNKKAKYKLNSENKILEVAQLNSDAPDKSYKEQVSINEEQTFFEVTPLIENVELDSQKDLCSISISEVDFPKIVYMIVDNKIELIARPLRDFPDWSFLPVEDQEKKTLKIYFESKAAKRDCKKEQKVIKVPNTNVFKIVAPILVSRGIARIVSENQLIAL